MASSLQRKAEHELRRVSAEEGIVHPEGASTTDEMPTVISKTPPVAPAANGTGSKVSSLTRKPTTPDSIVASVRGKKLAHFELISPIGVGGMAAVIRARDTQLDRYVALKILPPEMADEPDNVQRFHQEARAAAKLDHENIARVFFCGEDQGLHFIAFEFVEGINLRTMLEQRGRIPVAEAVRYILQVATGLEHAVSRAVVHRDVKPSNIIVTPTGRAKLVDMGLARNLERHGEADLTHSGMTLGTFDYISPEQALEPREADARSDIYSLGCTFYHLLTGMPPVPEGTPAKKLDHHQHHAPTDPRQIDPRIPDDIVMILNKMMAKNPKDRYQRPIQLVHHLMQVAQKVGAVDDVPEGVMFVDAPLPGQMKQRPLLAIGLALSALVVLTLLLSLVPDHGPSVPVKNASHLQDAKGNGPNPEPSNPTPKKNATPVTQRPEVATDRSELERVFDDTASSHITAEIDGLVNVETGLVFRGGKDRRLKLTSRDNTYSGTQFQFAKNQSPQGLLVEGGEKVEFHGLRFELSQQTTPKEGVVAAAVTLRGVKEAKFVQCVFVQPNALKLPYKRGPMASLFIDTPAGAEHPRPVVTLDDCLFDNTPQSVGQFAIAINGAATVHVTNCAFMPHATLFQFRKDCTKENTSVHLRHCDAFVVHGPAFRFTPNTSAQVHASHNVFSRPVSELSPATSPDVVSPQGNLIFLPERASVEYFGDSNVYHNLNAFVERPSKEVTLEKKDGMVLMDARQEFLAKTRGKDMYAIVLGERMDPRRHPTVLGRAEELTFQLKSEYHHKFGLTKTWLGNDVPAPEGIVAKGPTPQPKSREKIVEDPDMPPGARRTLTEALAGAEDGDVILVKHGENPEIAIAPTKQLKPGASVTIKPFPGYEPILILDKAFNRDRDTFLFQVMDGKLQIENMELVLDPVNANFDSQSIVHLGESAQCVFKNCFLTLRSTNAVPLNVVTFLDLDRMMKTEGPSPSAARVEFQECFIRGKGDLVGLVGCRMLNVDVKHSLVALEGSLLDVRASNRPMPMNQSMNWRMERSSIFTTEPIFTLHSRAGKGLTKTNAEVKGCLVAALPVKMGMGPKLPIVELNLEGPMEKYLDWRGEQNYYANFDREKAADWQSLYRETNSVYGRLTLMDWKEENVERLWEATPDWFKPSEPDAKNVSDFGLPPAMEKRMTPPSSKSDDEP